MNAESLSLVVVDDDEVITQMMGLMLSGHEVTSFNRPEPALERLGVEPVSAKIVLPDAVYTDFDYGIEGTNGVVFARRVREMHPTLPIVLMSSDLGRPEIQRDIPDLDLAITLRKPFNIATLLSTLSAVRSWSPRAA